MKLLFMFTGGTIGSAVKGEYISTDSNVPYELIKSYEKRYGFGYGYDVMTPYTKLSEQNTGATITSLMESVYGVVSDSKNIYDGIIVTHGTDSLPYSAAALSCALGNSCIPVCLVSSNYPIADERANGVDNLHGAVRLIEAGVRNNETGTGNYIRGVFVPYKNHDGVTYIHRGDRLLETAAFSDEYFSVQNDYYGSIENDRFVLNPEHSKAEHDTKGMGPVKLPDICDNIFRYHVYPGISFDSPDVICERIDDNNTFACPFTGTAIKNVCVLLEAYHSGTMNTELEQYRELFDTLYGNGVPVFLTGVKNGISYDSTSLYDKLHIIPLYEVAPVTAYMKLWMASAQG